MKASRFSDAQKAFILKQGADGMPVADTLPLIDPRSREGPNFPLPLAVQNKQLDDMAVGVALNLGASPDLHKLIVG